MSDPEYDVGSGVSNDERGQRTGSSANSEGDYTLVIIEIRATSKLLQMLVKTAIMLRKINIYRCKYKI